MKNYCVYDKASGRITARLTLPEGQLAANVPEGFDVIEGEHDINAARVDVKTKKVVEHRPPAPEPAEHYTWSPFMRAWQLREDIAKKNAARVAALAGIEALEKMQARPLREVALNPSAKVAKQRIEEIDGEIAKLRAVVNANPVT